MKKLKIAGIVLILFILYVIIGMLVPFVHMQSVSKTNTPQILKCAQKVGIFDKNRQ